MSVIGAISRFRIGRTGAAEFAALVGIGVFLASIGAFDSRGGYKSYVYWITVMVGGGVIGALIEPMLWRIPWLAERPWRLMAAQAVGMTPWIAVFVWLVSGLWFGDGLAPWRWFALLTPVFIIDVMVVIMAWLIRRGAAALAQPAPTREGAAPPAIREKLPPRLARADLYAVEAEDHYLRVHTAAGDALILMRLTDALAALEGSPGLRTHRSWWVMRSAVEEARFSRGRGELTLSNGVKAPVSRAYAADVRAADWAL